LTRGDTDELTENINSFFRSVSADLQPLNFETIISVDDTDTLPEELIIEPYDLEPKLAHNNIYKSP